VAEGRVDPGGASVLGDRRAGMVMWRLMGDLTHDRAVSWSGRHVVGSEAHYVPRLASGKRHGHGPDGKAANGITNREPGAEVHVFQYTRMALQPR
jgi:hypothetical protein